jgi:hypothetical protein
MTELRALLLTGMVLLTTSSATSQELTRAVLTSGDIRVELLLDGVPADRALMVTFTSTNPQKHSVICLSAHRDLVYVLKDSSGAIIPVAAKFRDLPDPHTGSNFGPGAFKDYCAIPVSKRQTRIYLSDLYPKLPSGDYKLWVTFVSRDHQASTVPIPMSIKV